MSDLKSNLKNVSKIQGITSRDGDDSPADETMFWSDREFASAMNQKSDRE